MRRMPVAPDVLAEGEQWSRIDEARGPSTAARQDTKASLAQGCRKQVGGVD